MLLKYSGKSYTSKIDIWSVGCVFAEFYLRKVLFGEKELSKQLYRLIALLGLPPESIMSQIKDPKVKDFLSEAAKKTKRLTFKDILPGLEPDAEDLLLKLLEYNPAKRLSAEEALTHPYFKDLHS